LSERDCKGVAEPLVFGFAVFDAVGGGGEPLQE